MKQNKNKIYMIGVCFLVLIFVALGVYIAKNKYSEEFTAPKSIKIGVSAYKLSDTFIHSILTEMEKKAKEYEQESGIKVTLDISDAKENQRMQNDQIKKYISLGYDVICVNIVDRTSASTIIDYGIDAEIPLIFFNREPVEEDILRGKDIYYVGSDAKTSAVLQGEIIVDAYNANPKTIDKNGNGILEYVILEGEMGHQDALIRTEWAVRTLEENGINVEKIQGGIANWDRSQGAALMEQWMNEYGSQIELVICNNDDMALGAADALEKLGRDDVKIVGIDATPQGMEAVRDGRIMGTVDCDPQKHAEVIFDMAAGLAYNGKLPKTIEPEKERYVRVDLKNVTKNSNIDK